MNVVTILTQAFLTARILERIQNVKPSFDASKWEAEAEDQARLVQLLERIVYTEGG